MELTIEKLVYGGDGLARVPGDGGRPKSVFLPYVLPGERVEATVLDERPGFARARLERVLKTSALRIEPPCHYFAKCGGCHYQHTGYDEQIRLKSEILREALRRTAKIDLNIDNFGSQLGSGWLGWMTGWVGLGKYRRKIDLKVDNLGSQLPNPIVRHYGKDLG